MATKSGIPREPLLREWNAAFRYDATRMQVAGTSPPDGSLLEMPLTLTVTPLAQGGSSQGETLTAADIFFLDLTLNSEEDDDEADRLAVPTADELALMLVE